MGCLGEAVGLVVGIIGLLLLSGGSSILGGVLLLAGIVFFIWGFIAARPPKCPYCKGKIEKGATVCKNCGRELPKK